MIKSKLNKNGLFCGTIFGNRNLIEFGLATLSMQEKYKYKMHHMILPGIETKTLGLILQSLNFKDSSVMNFKKKLFFSSIKEMIDFIRILGGSNCLVQKRKTALSKTFFKDVEKEMLFLQTDTQIPSNYFEDSEIPKKIQCTFDINIFFCFN